MKRQLWYENYSLIVLLIFLLIMMLVSPFVKGMPHANLILRVFFSLFLIAAVIASTHSKAHTFFIVILGILALIVGWGDFFSNTLSGITFNLLIDIIFIGYVVWIHLIKIIRTDTVSSNLLYGALSVYLLIGLLMAFVYMLIDLYYPASFPSSIAVFQNGHYSLEQHYLKYLYYSFITLTTLGYGDITPLSAQSQAFAYLEAVAGQFYLTVLVARLVGIYLFQNKKEKTDIL